MIKDLKNSSFWEWWRVFCQYDIYSCFIKPAKFFYCSSIWQISVEVSWVKIFWHLHQVRVKASLKGWFSLATESEKRRAYDLVKTAFRFHLRLRRLLSAYDLVKTRLSGSEAEAEELHQSQSARTCIVIGLSFRFCFRLRQSCFHQIISGT